MYIIKVSDMFIIHLDLELLPERKGEVVPFAYEIVTEGIKFYYKYRCEKSSAEVSMTYDWSEMSNELWNAAMNLNVVMLTSQCKDQYFEVGFADDTEDVCNE